jgi:hypothetical protein
MSEFEVADSAKLFRHTLLARAVEPLKPRGNRFYWFGPCRVVAIWLQPNKWQEPGEYSFFITVEVWLTPVIDGYSESSPLVGLDNPHWVYRLSRDLGEDYAGAVWTFPRQADPETCKELQGLASELAQTALPRIVNRSAAAAIAEQWRTGNHTFAAAIYRRDFPAYLEVALNKCPDDLQAPRRIT